AHVRPGRDDVALPGASSKGAAQQVADLARGGERRLVPGGLIVADEADEVVLVHPHIPACPALIVEVRAQVAVGKLRGEERAHHAVHQGLEPFVAGIEPGVGGGVQELAGVLADPILLAGALLKAFEDALFVYVKQASFQIDAHAIAQQSLHALAGIRGWREPVGHPKTLGIRLGAELLGRASNVWKLLPGLEVAAGGRMNYFASAPAKAAECSSTLIGFVRSMMSCDFATSAAVPCTTSRYLSVLTANSYCTTLSFGIPMP